MSKFVETTFAAAVNEFAVNPAANGKTLRELLNSNPQEFFRNAVPLLKRLEEEPGSNYVLVLLLSNGSLLRDLLKDGLFQPDELVAIARQLSKADPQFGVKLLKSVMPETGEQPSGDASDVGMRLRLMDVLQSVSDGQRILPVMMRLLRDPDARVRSKAALLVGRTTNSTRWVEECMGGERDSRVRANAVESLWDNDSEGVRALLWNALSDTDNRVLGNALLGLYRLGEAASIEHILRMAQDPRDLYRATASWVMGRTGDGRFQTILVNLMRDCPSVRNNAFRALCSINQTKARVAQAPALRLNSWRSSSKPDAKQDKEEIQLTLSVEPELETELDEAESLRPKSTLVSGVRPTEFMLYRDSSLVVNYEVSEISRTSPLALVFLLPAPDSMRANYSAGLRAAAASRRPTDPWLIARYDHASGRKSELKQASPQWKSSGPLNIRSASETPVRATPPGPLTFLMDSDLLDQALNAEVHQPTPYPTALKCLEAAVRAAHHAKSPQFVLLLPPNADEFSLDFFTEAVKAVSTLKAGFHAISLFSAESAPFGAGLQSLCQKSGGSCHRTDSAQLPQLVADLSALLINSYRIRVPAAPGSLKILVQSERGRGTLLLDAADQSAA